MNYFDPYPLCVDETATAAWESQLAEAENTPWLASTLAGRTSEIFPRFVAAYMNLRALPRGARRSLQRRLACSRDVPERLPEWLQRGEGRRLRYQLARSLAGAALLLALGQNVRAAQITVNTNVPGIAADGKCSLIEAIINANNDAATHPDCAAGSGPDTIVLPAKKIITLTTPYTNYPGGTGLPVITSQITIEGNGAKITRGKTAPYFGLMGVRQYGTLTLQRVTVSRGKTVGPQGGAGIYNFGTLNIENSTISGNTALDDPDIYNGIGGGILNYGELIVVNSIISGNSAYYGGGVYNTYGATATIIRSTISKNKAGHQTTNYGFLYGGGGGIFIFEGNLTIDGSVISGNTARYGGGVWSSGSTSIRNSRIEKNTAKTNMNFGGFGGGVFNGSGTLSIENSTISGNAAVSNPAGGSSYAIAGGIFITGSGLTIMNSTVSGNIAKTGAASSVAFSRGGGIYHSVETFSVTNSTISGNTAESGAAFDISIAYGGGMAGNAFSISITNSTISGNVVKSGPAGSYSYAGGGGMSEGGTIGLITNSTISANIVTSDAASNESSARGGGIGSYLNTIGIKNSTITGNTVRVGLAQRSYADGGGIFSNRALTLSHSLISGNSALLGAEVYNVGGVTADSYNVFGVNGQAGLFGVANGGSDIIPQAGITLKKILGPLKNNGGLTKTHALVPGSPAIDAAPVGPDCPATDQRGILRPQGAGCDIGAFEN